MGSNPISRTGLKIMVLRQSFIASDFFDEGMPHGLLNNTLRKSRILMGSRPKRAAFVLVQRLNASKTSLLWPLGLTLANILNIFPSLLIKKVVLLTPK